MLGNVDTLAAVHEGNLVLVHKLFATLSGEEFILHNLQYIVVIRCHFYYNGEKQTVRFMKTAGQSEKKMIYLFTALYCEAQMLIEQFDLKKALDPDRERVSDRFQQFRNDTGQILLTVTGAGEIAAAAAVSSVCTKYPPDEQDILLNVGTCAGPVGSHGVYYICKLTEQATGKTFYPDLLYRHSFREAELWTVMKPWKRAVQADCIVQASLTDEKDAGSKLYDMEAAALYQAGAYFFGPHQMIFVKIILDDGAGEILSAACVRTQMEAYKESLCGFLRQLLQMTYKESQAKDDARQSGTEQRLRQLCTDLHCTKAMEDSLRQYVRYAALAGTDWQHAVQKMYEENRLPCKDKREGKRCFETLKQRLL